MIMISQSIQIDRDPDLVDCFLVKMRNGNELYIFHEYIKFDQDKCRVSSSSFFLLFQEFLLFSSFLGKMSSLSSFFLFCPLNCTFGAILGPYQYIFFKKNFQPRFARHEQYISFTLFCSHSADNFTSSSHVHTSYGPIVSVKSRLKTLVYRLMCLQTKPEEHIYQNGQNLY